LCDEFQYFGTVGESEPTGDEKFLSLSRQPKCMPIVATQEHQFSEVIAAPAIPGGPFLQAFRTKIFLALSDDFSAKTGAELCGREEKSRVTYNLSESGHDALVSILSGFRQACSWRRPEEVIRRIADYRADEKHDPEYYPRHTVAKAQVALEHRATPQSCEAAEIDQNSREVP